MQEVGEEVFASLDSLLTRLNDVSQMEVIEGKDETFLNGLLQRHPKVEEKKGKGVERHYCEGGKFFVVQVSGKKAAWNATKAAKLVFKKARREDSTVASVSSPHFAASSLQQTTKAIFHNLGGIGAYAIVNDLSHRGMAPITLSLRSDTCLAAFPDTIPVEDIQGITTLADREVHVTDVHHNARKQLSGITNDAPSLPDGLVLIEDFITEEEEAGLLKEYAPDSPAWDEEVMKRRVAQYGYHFDYVTGTKLVVSEKEQPSFLNFMTDKMEKYLPEEVNAHRLPDQVIVNEYIPGQGIGMHIDRPLLFDDTITVVSVGADVIIDFINKDAEGIQHCKVPIPRRSCYVMTKDSRYVWQHGISAANYDCYKGALVKRCRRISFTFRKVTPTARQNSGVYVCGKPYATPTKLLGVMQNLGERASEGVHDLVYYHPHGHMLSPSADDVHAIDSNSVVNSQHPDGSVTQWCLESAINNAFSAEKIVRYEYPKPSPVPVTLAGVSYNTKEDLQEALSDIPDGEATGRDMFLLLSLLKFLPKELVHSRVTSLGRCGEKFYVSCEGSPPRNWGPSSVLRQLYGITHRAKG